MVWLCGVDGFKEQWLAVLRNLETDEFRWRIMTFQELLNLPENPAIVAVDVPIGLPDITFPGGRTCEGCARKMLGGARGRSVFSSVGRNALTASSREEADKLSRASGGIGVSAQAWGLARKLLEVDDVMKPELQHVIHEVHPEVSFMQMAGRSLEHGKKTSNGAHERVDALIKVGFPKQFVTSTIETLIAARGDFLDACASLWTAERIYLRTAQRLPRLVERDARGIDMAIWF